MEKETNTKKATTRARKTSSTKTTKDETKKTTTRKASTKTSKTTAAKKTTTTKAKPKTTTGVKKTTSNSETTTRTRKTPVTKKKEIEVEIKEPVVVETKTPKKRKLKKEVMAFIVLIILVLITITTVLINNYIHRDLDTIVLETHANEIYEWQYDIGKKEIVEFHKKQRSGDLEGKTQEGLITERYIFKALKPGKTTIKFTFMNTKNGSYGEIKEYTVTVEKNMKLTIEEKKFS